LDAIVAAGVEKLCGEFIVFRYEFQVWEGSKIVSQVGKE